MPQVFVSYSRRDAEFVTRLADELRGRGKDVWVDVEGIRDAEVFPVALRHAIERSDTFLFVISPDSVNSPFCDQEVTHANELNKRIIPLALSPVADEEIPEEIRFRNWIPVVADPAHDVDRIVAAIDTDLAWEQEHTRITVRALEWDAGGHNRSSLLRGTDLAAAEQWLAAGVDKDPGPTALEQEYLLAARQAAGRRQRTLVGGSLAVAAVAIGLLIFALISRGSAVSAETNAKAQALAAQSQIQQSVDGERAVLLAAAAVRTKVSYGATGTMFALRSAIDASTIRYRLQDAGTQGCGAPQVVYTRRHAATCSRRGCARRDPARRRNHRLDHTHDPGRRGRTDGAGLLGRGLRPRGGRWGAAARTRSTDGTGAHDQPPIPGLTVFATDPRAPIAAAVGVYQLDIWNMATGRLEVIHPPHAQQYGHPSAITFSPNGGRIAIGFDSPTMARGCSCTTWGAERSSAPRRRRRAPSPSRPAAARWPSGRSSRRAARWSCSMPTP